MITVHEHDALSLARGGDPVRTWNATPGHPISSYLSGGAHWSVQLNGQHVKPFGYGFRPRRGDVLDLVAVPRDPTGGSLIGLITFVLFVASVGLSIASAAGAFAAKPRTPGPRGPREEDVAPSPFFTGVQTTVGSDRPVPIVLGGPVRIGGHVIESATHPKFDLVPDSFPTGVVSVGGLEQQQNSARALYTRIAWGWGPFESIENFEIDGNPVENVRGVTYETKLGTRDQAVPFGISEVRKPKLVEEIVTQVGGAVIERTVGSPNSVEVELIFTQGLFALSNDGSILTHTISVEFAYKKASFGSYTVFKQASIDGAQQSPMSYWVRFPDLEPSEQYDIRVTRVTADNTDPLVQNSFVWQQLVEVENGRRAHPGIANTGFSQIPQEQTAAPREYSAEARAPSNVRVYSTPIEYVEQWTSNPAWLCAHWITSFYYGPGKYYTYDDIDLAAWLDWADHCDELVSDGVGGLEPRCRMALEQKQRLNVDQWRQIFEQAGEAKLIETGGRWTVVPNGTRPVKEVFNEGTYETASGGWTPVNRTERPARITGRFLNERRRFQPDGVSRTDNTVSPGILLRSETVTYWGVTRRSQVIRSIERRLAYNRLSDDVVEFTAGVRAIRLKAGQVFRFASAVGGRSLGNGRLVEVEPTYTRLKLDRNVSLQASKTYEAVLQHQDEDRTITVKRLIGVQDGVTDEIRLETPPKEIPRPGDLWSVGELDMATALYEVEETSLDDRYMRRIVGVKYDPDSFDPLFTGDEEEGVSLVNQNFMPSPVTSLTVRSRKPQDSAGNTRNVIDVSWALSTGLDLVRGYQVYWRTQGKSLWLFAGETLNLAFTIDNTNLVAGTYEVAVVSVSPTGRRLGISDSAQGTVVVS